MSKVSQHKINVNNKYVVNNIDNNNNNSNNSINNMDNQDIDFGELMEEESELKLDNSESQVINHLETRRMFKTNKN